MLLQSTHFLDIRGTQITQLMISFDNIHAALETFQIYMHLDNDALTSSIREIIQSEITSLDMLIEKNNLILALLTSYMANVRQKAQKRTKAPPTGQPTKKPKLGREISIQPSPPPSSPPSRQPTPPPSPPHSVEEEDADEAEARTKIAEGTIILPLYSNLRQIRREVRWFPNEHPNTPRFYCIATKTSFDLNDPEKLSFVDLKKKLSLLRFSLDPR